MPRNGSGLIRGFSAPKPANSSAFSFPGTPSCPETHSTVTVKISQLIQAIFTTTVLESTDGIDRRPTIPIYKDVLNTGGDNSFGFNYSRYG